MKNNSAIMWKDIAGGWVVRVFDNSSIYRCIKNSLRKMIYKECVETNNNKEKYGIKFTSRNSNLISRKFKLISRNCLNSISGLLNA